MLKKSRATVTVTFKMTPEERAELQEKADEYTEGNLSDWIRYATLKLEPREQDLVGG